MEMNGLQKWNSVALAWLENNKSRAYKTVELGQNE